jgi:hypothetical protein
MPGYRGRRQRPPLSQPLVNITSIIRLTENPSEMGPVEIPLTFGYARQLSFSNVGSGTALSIGVWAGCRSRSSEPS